MIAPARGPWQAGANLRTAVAHFRFQRVPAGVKLQLGAVVVVDGPERPHDGEIVGAHADVTEPVAHHQAASAVGLVAGLQRHDDLAVAVGRVAAEHVFVFRRENAGPSDD